MDVVVIMRLGDANVYYHVKPIAMCEKVERVWIIRPLPPGDRGTIENASYLEIEGQGTARKLWGALKKAMELGKQEKVKAFVSFNAVPYGLIALLAGLRYGKPVHIGFVGSDWYRDCTTWRGWFLNWLLRKAAIFTVTGDLMKQEMVEKGYPPERIHHLPHAIDIDEYDNPPPADRSFDCVFVGWLIHRKRVDLILDAISRVKQSYPEVSLCIVGEGPMRDELETRSERLGLQGNVVFTGFQPRPAAYFSNARVVLMASDMEGFPFTLVEGIAAGAVPVSTDVGTISDFIGHNVDGLLVPPNDLESLAQAVLSILDDRELYGRLRANVLAKRQEYSFGHVVSLWTTLLGQMTDEVGES